MEFTDGLVVIYADYSDDYDTYLACNYSRLIESYWYPSIDNLWEGIDIDGVDDIPNNISYRYELYKIHSYYVNGKETTLLQAQEEYPELFL